MTFQDKVVGYVKAAYPIMLIQSAEYERVVPELKVIADGGAGPKLQVMEWNVLDGFRSNGRPVNDESKDPLAALMMVRSGNMPEKALYIFRDFHQYLPGAEVIEALRQLAEIGKATNRYIILLSPIPEVPRKL